MCSKPPQEIEKEFVNDVYDVIAKHFDHTRYKPWPAVAQFVSDLPENAVVLDLGCGNGRNMAINSKVIDMGSDFSMPLCQIAAQRQRPVFCASALAVPVRDGVYDHVICIAVIHHFASPERRTQCLREIARITRVGGTALVTAWATEQRKKKYGEQDQMISWTVDRRFGEAGLKLDRFYHMFEEGEFAELVKDVKELELVREWYEADNWHAIFKRVEGKQ